MTEFKVVLIMFLGCAFPFGNTLSQGDLCSEKSPAQLALDKLNNNPDAKKRLASMRVEISKFTGTLNIFDSKIEDLKYFAQILDNEDYSYDPLFGLTSFYY